MKKLLTILFILIAYVSYGQYAPMTAYGYKYKRLMADSTLHIPNFCGVASLRDTTTKKAAIAFDSCNNRLYFYNPKTFTWGYFSGGGFDTTTIYETINNILTYIYDTSFTNQFMPAGIVLDTTYFVSGTQDSVRAYVYTDGTVIYDTLGRSLLTSFTNNVINILNILDSARSDTTFARGRLRFFHDPNSRNDTLELLAFTVDTLGGVPPPGTVTGKFLRDDGTWQTAGTGSLQQVTDVGDTTTHDIIFKSTAVGGFDIARLYQDSEQSILELNDIYGGRTWLQPLALNFQNAGGFEAQININGSMSANTTVTIPTDGGGTMATKARLNGVTYDADGTGLIDLGTAGGGSGNDSAYVNITQPNGNTLIHTRDNNGQDTAQFFIKPTNQLFPISGTSALISTFNLPTVSGGAAVFSGNQVLLRPVNKSLQIETGGTGITISSWVYLDTLRAAEVIAAVDDDLSTAGSEYHLSYFEPYGSFNFQIETPITTRFITSSIGTPSVATWYYVQGWYDQAQTKVFIRVNNTVDSLDFAETTFHTTTTPFTLGADARVYSPNTNSYLRGQLKNVRFFKRTLTAAESTALYNGGTPVPYASLPAVMLRDPYFISSWDFLDVNDIGADSR